ncbi:hypothetical protein NE237_003718 [Protea cynaroides]|uniref:Uncharacterized protein n=1 Tax=Protea cynaroides TaxID=273540 RepID=A0A9Q0QSZ8_9MAGN|nr:hypothetical protein NE237_003718 [Protea cynaroides]
MDYSSSENGFIPSSSYHNNQQTAIFNRGARWTERFIKCFYFISFGGSKWTSSAYGYSNIGYQHGYNYPQQITSSYSDKGEYMNIPGALHQPLISIQNAGSAIYTSTNYNAADYQTTGGYPSNECTLFLSSAFTLLQILMVLKVLVL